MTALRRIAAASVAQVYRDPRTWSFIALLTVAAVIATYAWGASHWPWWKVAIYAVAIGVLRIVHDFVFGEIRDRVRARRS